MIDTLFGHIHFLSEIKLTLMENIVLPFKFPHLFQGARHGISSILLFGAPGTGKSYLIKSLSYLNHIDLDLNDQETDDQCCERIMKTLEEPKQNGKFLLIIENIDQINYKGPKSRMALFGLLQNIGLNFTIIGTSNKPYLIEPWVRRKFELRLYIPLLNNAQICQLTDKKLLGYNTKDIMDIVEYGFNGQQIVDPEQIDQINQWKEQFANYNL